jgi:DNA-binding transcriptional MocR family regulator
MLNLQLAPGTGDPLVEQLVSGCASTSMRACCGPARALPSIRALAAQQGVSRFTVVEPMIASWPRSRRIAAWLRILCRDARRARDGRGAHRQSSIAASMSRTSSRSCAATRRARTSRRVACSPGGCLPNDWQEESGIRRYARLVAEPGRGDHRLRHRAGLSRPLRELIARRTADVGLSVTAEQVLLTNRGHACLSTC